MPFRTPARDTRIVASALPPLAAFSLEFVDLGVIGVARQRFLRRAPVLERLAKVGCVDAELLGQARGDGNVLGHERQLKAGGKGAGQHLQWDLALGGVVVASRSVDRVEHRLWLEAQSTRQE